MPGGEDDRAGPDQEDGGGVRGRLPCAARPTPPGNVPKSAADRDRDLVEACRAAPHDEPLIHPGAATTLIRTYLDRARTGDSNSLIRQQM